MAIRTDFLVKHVRPISEDGYVAFCNNDMIGFLQNTLQFQYGDIIEIFARWRQTANADPHEQSDLFIRAANEVSQARWQELYPTDKSSIMFLNAGHLVSLSAAGERAGANADFTWRPDHKIAICVTIRQGGGHHIIWDARGCKAKTDSHANVFHFEDVVA